MTQYLNFMAVLPAAPVYSRGTSEARVHLGRDKLLSLAWGVGQSEGTEFCC